MSRYCAAVVSFSLGYYQASPRKPCNVNSKACFDLTGFATGQEHCKSNFKGGHAYLNLGAMIRFLKNNKGNSLASFHFKGSVNEQSIDNGLKPWPILNFV